MPEIRVQSKINENDEYADFYICSHSQHGCNCKIIIKKDGNAIQVGNHNEDIFHSMENQIYMRTKVKEFILNEMQKNSNSTTTDIILKLIKEFKINNLFPSKKFISSTISSFKQNKFGRGPKKLKDINPDLINEKFDGFCIFDKEYVERKKKQRIMIFSTNEQLELLKSPNLELFSDQVYKHIPKYFLQMMIIHVKVGMVAHPIMYILMTNKTKRSYDYVFDFISRKYNPSVLSIMMDYEMAPRSSAKKILSSIPGQGMLVSLLSGYIQEYSFIGIKKRIYRKCKN